MGWFWSDFQPAAATIRAPHPMPNDASLSPPPSCPMHRKGTESITPHPSPPSLASACPYTPTDIPGSNDAPKQRSKYNPLNYMFSDLSQDRAPSQKVILDTEREISTIPKGEGSGTWEYPSPQQMYNALLRKGYHDTDPEHVTSMVSVHNFLNEGAWQEIRAWEGMFSEGLKEGWKKTQMGEQGVKEALVAGEEPSLMRFQGRPKDMTPKAAMVQLLGRIWPSRYETEPPFDRHDWYVQRKVGEEVMEVRYVIDYYSAPDDENGQPVFNLDVRPAVDSPILAMERMVRAGGDIWYKASGASVRGRDTGAFVNGKQSA